MSSLCRYLTRWPEGRATEIVAQVAGVVVIALVPGAFAVWVAYRLASALRTRSCGFVRKLRVPHSTRGTFQHSKESYRRAARLTNPWIWFTR